MLIKEYLFQKTDPIESIEHTNTSTEKGKWFFIVKKAKVPIPRRAQTRATQEIGSYASVSMGLAGTQDEDTHLKNPMWSRKRVATAVSTENNNQTQRNTNNNTGKKVVKQHGQTENA
eukprot:15332234-Ditylum_brightwellii.AAC.1